MNRLSTFVLIMLLLLAGCAQTGRKPAIEASLGAPAPAAPGASALADKDGDGVPDIRDECPATPPNTYVDAFGCPVPLYLHVILPCGSDAALADPSFLSKLEAVAVLLRDNPASRASVEVHSAEHDAMGRVEPTQQRAEKVKALLAKRLADGAARIEAKGLGSTRPMVSNASDAGRQRNRRVEIIITGVYKDPPKQSERSALGMSLSELSFQDIRFPRAEVGTDADGGETIYRLARLLQVFPQTQATLSGHADSRGNPTMNQELSEQRAWWVKTRLVNEFGISSERLHPVGFGHRLPVADNATPEGRAANRRVAIDIEKSSHPALARRAPSSQPPRATSSPPAPMLTERPVGSKHARVSELPAEATERPVQLATAPQEMDDGAAAEVQPADVTYEPIPSKRVQKKAQADAVEKAPVRPVPGRTYSIEVSVSRCRLWLYEMLPGGGRKLVNTYAVATAKPGAGYPQGTGYVTKIDLNPSWVPTPNMIRAAHRKGKRLPRYVPPGSRANPMGEFKIHISHGEVYRIHGTNKPGQIGQRVSSGCIRMHNGEGRHMAKAISVGTKVDIRY